MWTVYVPECALRGADLSPSYVIEIHSSSICCIVLISDSPTGLVLPGSDVKHCTPLLMAVDTETNNKDDAFDAVDQKTDETSENAGLGMGALDGGVAAGERAHHC